ncbi:conjugal transfer protein TraB [Acidithiobacillus thiooxidans]|uniref:Conjugal transfer protein TraB n=2 Tax=Acidithiobacillus thiooxidans TaxID=930 RepID=A0A5P9XST0_ACITH|nr:conjugal transfer protein TraB [Acidithiobacillus thiooxidans]QFX96740.1 hypothetical protein GCD22_02556 [Acidithiobacillus thiooxidans ATCC 19377]
MRLRWFLPVGGLACGASWMLPVSWVAPLLSLVFVLLVLAGGTRALRFTTAIAYYGAGSIGLVRGVDAFFGPDSSLIEGMFLWLGASALLSIGWILVNRPWKAVVVLLFDALVPPLALFDWMSPLSAAGMLFPGTGIVGIMSYLAVFPLLDRGLWKVLMQKVRWVLLMILIILAIVLNGQYQPEPVPEGWQGTVLHVGPEKRNILAGQERQDRIIQQIQKQAPDARIVLLPETLITAWIGNLHAFEQAVRPGSVWLVGAAVPRQPGVLTDSIMAVTQDKARILFNSAFPVPVSMWRPWVAWWGHAPRSYLYRHGARFRAAWWEPVRIMAGKRVFASICYDQLLPAVWLEAAWQRPQVVLLTNDEWWARKTGIPVIQHNSSWAWTRLLGAAGIEAENF